MNLGTSGYTGVPGVLINSVVGGFGLSAESCNAWSQWWLGEGGWPRQEVTSCGQGRGPLQLPTCGASRALPKSRRPGSFMKPHVRGNHHPQGGLLAALQPSNLPGEAVSPCFGPIFHVGFPETPNRSCDRRHGSGTAYISKIPNSIFRCLLPCAHTQPPTPLHSRPQTYPFIMSNILLSSRE